MDEYKNNFSVGELAQICGVTVRTLQYYDRNGLLQASLTDGGRRVYSRKDLFSLQQILFLKALGFSLNQIKGQILSESDSENIIKVFEKQYDILKDQMVNLQKRMDTLELAVNEARENQTVSLEKIMTILELMRESNPYAFIVRYFSAEQIKTILERSPQSNEVLAERASRIFSKLEQLYNQKADPKSFEAQEFAKDWWSMAQDFAGDDSQLFNTLITTGSDLDNWPKEAVNIKEMFHELLSPALNFYLTKHNINIDHSKEGNI